MNEVKKPKKPMFFYYIIVLMAILLFNSLAMPMITENKIKEVDYGTFISMTESGKVKRHQLADELDRRLKERAE